jgi:hypothetical protein
MAQDVSVKAILLIVVLVVGIGTFTSITNPVVRTLLGFADASTLDDSTKEKYDYLKDINEENVNSINALLFSINTIAHYDTNLNEKEKPLFLDKMFSDEQSRIFGNQEVKYTFSNLETIYINDDDSVNVAAQKLADLAVRCFFIMEDNGNQKSRCFQVDFSNMNFVGSKLNEKVLKDEAIEFKTSGYCDDKCKEKIEYIFEKGVSKRYDLTVSGGISKSKTLYVCAEPRVLQSNRIFIVDNLNHHACDVKEEKNDIIGMKVNNFHMKQDVGNVNDYTKFLFGYKPNVFYYEQVNSKIAQDFEASLYSFDFGTALRWELVASALFDFIPALKPVRKLAGSIIKRAGKEFFEQSGKETLEELGEKFFKQIFKSLDERLATAKGIKGIYNAIKGSFESVNGLISRVKSLPGDAIQAALRGVFGDGMEGASARLVRTMAMNNQVNRWAKVVAEDFFEEGFEEFAQGVGEVTARELQEEFVEGLTEESVEKVARGLSSELSDEEIELVFKKVFGEYDEIPADIVQNAQQRAISFRDTYNQNVVQIDEKFVFVELQREMRKNAQILSKLQVSLDRLFFEGFEDAEQEIIIRELLNEDVDKVFGSMLNNKQDMARFLSNNKLNIKDLEASNVFTNPKMGEEFLGKIDDLPFNARYGAAINKEFTSQGGFKEIGVNPILKKRRLLILALWYKSAKEVSDAELFHPVGVNSFGYKTSLSTPAIFDDYYRKDWDYSKTDDKKKYNDYFQNYGYSEIPGKVKRSEKLDDKGINYDKEKYMSEKYTGTIPAIYNYFVGLTKDKHGFWKDQPPDRFYLVAPCKADMNIELTQIQCYGKPNEVDEGINVFGLRLFANEAKYETGTFNPLLDKTVDHFDGKNAMLYSVDENGDLTKDCKTQGVGEFLNPFDTPYTPTTITVNPVLDKNLDMNYCYKGMDVQQATADITFNYGIPIAAGIGAGSVCLGHPACLFMGGAFGGILGVIGYKTYENLIAGDRYYWPYHNSGWFEGIKK